MSTIVCGATSLALALVFRSGEPSHRVASFWAWSILAICRVKVVVTGQENLEPGQTYVLASNHQSLFDTPILFAFLPISFRILYKKSLNRIPFLGWHLFLSGHVGVERDNPTRARASLEDAAARIRTGTSVVLFPEGTRSYDGVLQSFKKGSFRLAIRAQAPLVPMTIIDSHLVMKRGRVTVYPRTVQLRIHQPLVVAGRDESDMPSLMSEVRDIISGGLQETSP